MHIQRTARSRPGFLRKIQIPALALALLTAWALSWHLGAYTAVRRELADRAGCFLKVLDREWPSRHKLAVIVPYRDKESTARQMIPVTQRCIEAGGLSQEDYGIFFMEQSPRYHFNRGALLNIGALILDGTEYDYFALHDVDTICGPRDTVPYSYPSGRAPLHLTPPGLHPHYEFEEFVGGNIIFTKEQFRRVNGFQNGMWGWGKEDNNMVRRLQLHGMWPPERPAVPWQQRKDHYWIHVDHSRAEEVRILPNPRNHGGFANLEPVVHNDNRWGLKETRFAILAIQAFHGAVKYTVEPFCDMRKTPWCELPPNVTGSLES